LLLYAGYAINRRGGCICYTIKCNTEECGWTKLITC
jgi:hypothetical protein